MMSSAGGRPSWRAMVCEGSFRRSARIPPSEDTPGITCRYDTTGHSLNSRLRRAPGLRGAGLRRSLGQRAFRLAGITPVDIGGVWLVVAATHLIRCLLVVLVHETSYLARQHEPDVVAGCGVK
jgi:hypothetical protein